MSDVPVDGGWWRASDGKWYPPERWNLDGSPDPALTALGAGWWFASDGRWYPPEQRPVPAAAPPPTMPAVVAAVDQLPPPHPLVGPGPLVDDPSAELEADEDADDDEGDDEGGSSHPDRYKGQAASTITIEDEWLVLDRTSRRNHAAGVPDRSPRYIPLAAITEVRLIPPTATRSGWFQVVHGGASPPGPTLTTWSKTPDTVMFSRPQRKRFKELADRLQAVIDENVRQGIDPALVDYPDRLADAGEAGSPSELNTSMPAKVERYLAKHPQLLPGEDIQAVLGGSGSPQVLVATDRRLLVVKVGWMAGSTGGGRTTAFNYADVTAIQVQLGISMGTLSVQSPGYGATQTGDYWAQRNQQNGMQLPNVIPWSKLEDKKYVQELTWIRARIDEARNPATPAPAGSGDIAQQLAHLGQLHTDGVLTDEEFSAAKARLLGT